MPDEVSDDEFWRNFFYHVELFKLNEGLENRLGDQVGDTTLEAIREEELRKAEEEISRLTKLNEEWGGAPLETAKVGAEVTEADQT